MKGNSRCSLCAQRSVTFRFSITVIRTTTNIISQMSLKFNQIVALTVESAALLVFEKLIFSVVATVVVSFLAHLSRRLTGELVVYPCSVVRPSVVRRFHNFKDLLL